MELVTHLSYQRIGYPLVPMESYYSIYYNYQGYYVGYYM